MKFKKAISLILAIAAFASLMTVDAFAAEPIDRVAKAEENCYTSGHYGSAESTGHVGADVRAAKGSEPHDAGAGLFYTRTNEKVTDAIKWTLKDGVLTLSGTGTVAKNLDLVFGGNKHIETIVIEEGVNHFTDSIKDLPNLKTIIVMDGNIQTFTLFSNCPNVQAVIVGANLEDDIYSGFKGKSGEYSGEMANKFIILTKNIGLNYKGAQLRSDFNGYSNGKLCVQDGKSLNNYASLAYHKDDVSTTSYDMLLSKAQSVIAALPASVQNKLPAALTGPVEPVEPTPIIPEEPVKPVEPVEPVKPGEPTQTPVTGTDDFTNSETRLRTSYNENNYVDISVSGNTMTVSGRLLVDGLTKVEIKCGGVKKDISTQSGGFFSTQLTLKHSGHSAVNVRTYARGSSSSYINDRIYIEKTSGGYRIMPSLVRENNTAFEHSRIDPSELLRAADVPGTVAAMSDKIVGSETDDYTKVFLLHKWVSENIYYDYDAYADVSLRSTDSAKILEERRGVCAGYTSLLRDLILAQGIPAMYSGNESLHASYAFRDRGGEDHAHTEAWVDGRWITMDATWDSNNEYRRGNYITKAPTGYYYFDISSEAFAMDHKITSRGGRNGVTDENGFTIRPSDGVLTKYTGKGGNIVIPDGVTAIQTFAFKDCGNVTGVVIPEGVTEIGSESFRNCTNLRSVTIPSSVTKIGYEAFISCTSLKRVVIPEGVTEIANSTFNGCRSLESVSLPKTLTAIRNSAFTGCEQLRGIVIPEGVTTIEYGAFFGCSSLTDVTIPNSVTFTMQDQSIFCFCENLRTVSLPDGMTQIPSSTFYGCKALTDVYIPAGITEIHYEAFNGCKALSNVYFGGTPEQWAAIAVAERNDSLKQAAVHCGETVIPPEETDKIEATDKTDKTEATDKTNKTEETEKPEKDTATISFSDVSADAYYAESVGWAVERGITNGTSATTFSPDQTCTTAQILTFLWRAYGSPAVDAKDSFVDVSADDYYYQAAQWAKNLQMADGPALSPHSPCTRASTVMFLWQAAGCPIVTTETSFTDVSADSDYAVAVAWALETGVTNGTSATTFSPDAICTRAQIMTLLYRALAV